MKPDWIEGAQRLLAQGVSREKVAKKIGVAPKTVRYHLDPEYRKQVKEFERERWRKNPEARNTSRGDWRVWALRLAARHEAAETGEDVVNIYRRWDVLRPIDLKRRKTLSEIKSGKP